jgi:hypothetical protein
MNQRKRHWVGVSRQVREVFSAVGEPTQESHGHLYGYVIGPFRTHRGASFMVQYGFDNPHCQSVSQAERLAKGQ